MANQQLSSVKILTAFFSHPNKIPVDHPGHIAGNKPNMKEWKEFNADCSKEERHALAVEATEISTRS